MLRKITHTLSVLLLIVCATYVGVQTHCSGIEGGMQIAPTAVGMCSNEAMATTGGFYEVQEEAVLSRTNASVSFALFGFVLALAVIAPRFIGRSAVRERMRRLLWVWARKMPFARPLFLPYFAAQRDAWIYI